MSPRRRGPRRKASATSRTRRPRRVALILATVLAVAVIGATAVIVRGGPSRPSPVAVESPSPVAVEPPTPAATPTTAAFSRVRAAFYYPWFPETEDWATRYRPTMGRYDSSDPNVLRTHVSQAKYAGLDAFISSYWGRGTPTAKRLPLLLEAARAQSFHIAPYYEPESNPTPPTAAELRADFDSLAALAANPAWLRVGGKPVLFIYNTKAEGSCAGINRVLTASAGRFYLNAKVFSKYRKCGRQPHSWHQYGPATPYIKQRTQSAIISPGFFKHDEAAPRLARDIARFRADLARQVQSGAQWQLTTSFNEWGEGTSVEPAEEWQSASGMGIYLDAMRAAYVGDGNGTPRSSATSPSPRAPTVAARTPSVSTDPVVAAAGDIACEPDKEPGESCQHEAVSDKILADDAISAVLTLGDNQYEEGDAGDFAKSFDVTWGRFKEKIKPVAGNHEYETSEAAGYFDYFGPAAGDPAKGYYSYEVGAWHFVALNSEIGTGPNSAQVAWLKADLKAHPNKCVAALFHRPRWSTGEHGGSEEVAPFVEALYEAKAELILSGHDHNYERFVPLNPAGERDAARGITQIVSGQGGKGHRSIAGGPMTVTKDNSSYGYSRLVLHKDSLDGSFVSAVGSYTDSFTIKCH